MEQYPAIKLFTRISMLFSWVVAGIAFLLGFGVE